MSFEFFDFLKAFLPSRAYVLHFDFGVHVLLVGFRVSSKNL